MARVDVRSRRVCATSVVDKNNSSGIQASRQPNIAISSDTKQCDLREKPNLRLQAARSRDFSARFQLGNYRHSCARERACSPLIKFIRCASDVVPSAAVDTIKFASGRRSREHAIAAYPRDDTPTWFHKTLNSARLRVQTSNERRAFWSNELIRATNFLFVSRRRSASSKRLSFALCSCVWWSGARGLQTHERTRADDDRKVASARHADDERRTRCERSKREASGERRRRKSGCSENKKKYRKRKRRRARPKV